MDRKAAQRAAMRKKCNQVQRMPSVASTSTSSSSSANAIPAEESAASRIAQLEAMAAANMPNIRKRHESALVRNAPFSVSETDTLLDIVISVDIVKLQEGPNACRKLHEKWVEIQQEWSTDNKWNLDSVVRVCVCVCVCLTVFSFKFIMFFILLCACVRVNVLFFIY